MAINVYTGVMGSGKTFEVVSSVILPAIASGRRVVTNIDGINEELIHQFLIDVQKIDASDLGSVLHVSNDDVAGKNGAFFPEEGHDGKPIPGIGIVKGGDLVAIDEAWKFWGQAVKIRNNDMAFFRLHRHFINPDTGVTCDLALMVQSIMDLHRNVRTVVELTAVMTKLKTVGLNKSYRVALYEGGRTLKTAQFDLFVKNYDTSIFPLYQSYSGGQGKEAVIDKRQNVLKNPRVWISAFVVLILFCVSLYYVFRFFKPKVPDSAVSASSGVTPGTSPVHPSPGTNTSEVTPGTSPVHPSPGTNTTVSGSVLGDVVINDAHWIAVSDAQGHFRLENPAAFVGKGFFLVGNVDGRKVATWTGNGIKQGQGQGQGQLLR